MNDISSIAGMIDHSILHPTFTDNDLKNQCDVARTYEVASVCVKPYAVKMAFSLLNHTNVKVGCVIGFPHGNSSVDVKKYETTRAIEDGAVEIDMVINIGKVLGGDWDYIENEIRTITETCHQSNAIVKVIFETDYITSEADKIHLCQLCTKVGVDYVKTSTGYGFVKKEDGNFNYAGATIEDVRLMRKFSGPNVKVKAAGGIRTLDDLLAMREAGASRVGATATSFIISEAEKRYGRI